MVVFCLAFLAAPPAHAFPAPETISSLAPSLAALWAALTGAAGAVAIRRSPILALVAAALVAVGGLLWLQSAERGRILDYSLERVYPLAVPAASAMSLERQAARADGAPLATLIAEAEAGAVPLVVWPEYSAERAHDRVHGALGRYLPIPIDASDEDLEAWFPGRREIVIVDWYGAVAADLAARLNRLGHRARFAVGGLRAWLAAQPSHHDTALAVDWDAIIAGGDLRLVDTNNRSNYWESGSWYGADNIPTIALLLVPELLKSERRPIRLFSYWQPPAGSDVPPGDALQAHATWPEAEAAARVLAARGLDARYVSGGYVELYRRGLGNVPPYPNHNRYLDAVEMHDLLVAADDVVYLDFRPPGIAEGERNPIPGRLVFHADLTDAAARAAWYDLLPRDKRYIGLGHDQRSHFLALRTGYELSRAGLVWLGIAGSPDLYSSVVARDAWTDYPDDLAGRARLALTEGRAPGLARAWHNARRDLADAASGLLAGGWGLLVLAGLVARLMVVPLTGRPGRALPWPRLLLLLGWIVGLCLLFADLAGNYRMLQDLPGPFGDGLLWPDRFHVLPLIAGALAAGQMIAAGWRGRRGLIGAAAVGILTGWLLWGVMQGLVLLLIGLGLGALLPGLIRRRPARPPLPATGIDPLGWADRLAGMPTKAVMQARLMRLGFRVPPGIVIVPPLLEPVLSGDPTATERLMVAIRPLGKNLIARSAGFGEDDDRALTGRFVSVPATPETLAAALREVAMSFAAAGLPAGIIVQKRLDADFAGVALSRAPLEPAAMLVEGGAARAVTDGAAPGFTLRLDRAGRPLDPLEATPGRGPRRLVAALGRALRRIEAAQGAPVALEWLWAGGRLWLVQLRLGADLAEAPPAEAERARLLDRPAVLDMRPFADLLPDPDPLTLDLYAGLYGAGAMPCFGRLAMARSGGHWRLPVGPAALAAAVRRDWPVITRDQGLAAATDLAALSPALLRQWLDARRRLLADMLWPLITAADRLARRDPAQILDLSYPGAGSGAVLAGLPPARLAQVFAHRGGAEAQLNARRFGTGRRLPWDAAPDLFTPLPVTAERLKDDLHDRLAHQIALMADGVAALGAALGLGPLIFACRFDELADPPPPEILSRRLADHATLQALDLPMPLDTRRLAAGLPAAPAPGGAIGGTVVSRFDAPITAPVLHVRPGETPVVDGRPILVAPRGDTALIPLLRHVAALVCAQGGQLSHIAIVARQLGVPAIMPAVLPGGLADGDGLTLHPDGRIERG